MTRYSVALPQFAPGNGDNAASALTREATHAAELGFSGLWTLDPAEPPISETPLLDGLQALVVAAASGVRLQLGIAVIILPRRNPVLLARELATLDRLSDGKLVVGVGIGRPADDVMTRLGLPHDRRARRLQEGVEAMRALWANPGACYAGEIFSFEGVTIEPPPMQRPGPPIWFGAKIRPALRRTARLADGWIGAGIASNAEFLEQSKELQEELFAAQRSIPKMKRVYIAVEADRATAYARLSAVLDPMYKSPGMTEHCAVYGSVEECALRLRELIDAGADEILLHPLYDHSRQLDALAAVAQLAGSAR